MVGSFSATKWLWDSKLDHLMKEIWYVNRVRIYHIQIICAQTINLKPQARLAVDITYQRLASTMRLEAGSDLPILGTVIVRICGIWTWVSTCLSYFTNRLSHYSSIMYGKVMDYSFTNLCLCINWSEMWLICLETLHK